MKFNELNLLFGFIGSWGAMVWLVAIVGCGPGWVQDNETQLLSIKLISDQLGALQMQNCINDLDQNSCSRYPNPNACNTMNVTVDIDGNTAASCAKKDNGNINNFRHFQYYFTDSLSIAQLFNGVPGITDSSSSLKPKCSYNLTFFSSSVSR